MTDYMAQMLNELMGPTRNALPGEQREIDFDHPDVCRDFLVGFCLHEAFRNTKNDLGYCPFPIHDEGMRKRYRESKRYGRLGYEEKYLDRVRRMHNEVQRKIEKNEARLHISSGEHNATADMVEKKKAELNEKREMLSKKIESLMEDAQVEGAKGNVAAAQAAVFKAEEITKEKDELALEEAKILEESQRAIVVEDALTAGNKQMQVCQICGCFMLTNDAQSRIDDHLSGKLHIAYTRIREYLEGAEKEREERQKMIHSEKAKERAERENREKEKDKDQDRSKRDRDRRDKDRERNDRSHRDRRSRSKDRHHRRDDRDRRDRDRDRRDRSRSRDRRHR